MSSRQSEERTMFLARKGKNHVYILSETLSSVYIQIYRSFYSNLFIFIQNKTETLIPELHHILTLIIIFTTRLY